MKQRFFITGGMRYLGSQFAKEALKKGDDVCLHDSLVSLVYEQDPSRMIKKVAEWIKNNLENLENSNFAEVLNMPLANWHKICQSNISIESPQKK